MQSDLPRTGIIHSKVTLQRVKRLFGPLLFTCDCSTRKLSSHILGQAGTGTDASGEKDTQWETLLAPVLASLDRSAKRTLSQSSGTCQRPVSDILDR